MAGGPDARAVDAAPAAVDQHAVHHQVQDVFPVVHLVVADQDLAEPGTVDLDRRVGLVPLHRGGPAEDQASGAVADHGGSHFPAPRIERDGLLGNACLKEGLGHAPGRPGLLGTGLQNQSDLKRDHRKPEAVDAGRIGGEHHAQHRSVGLVAAHQSSFFSIAATQHIQIQTSRQRAQDIADLVQHVPELGHVHAAHVLGKARGGRLLPDELLGSLSPLSQRQLGRREQAAGLLDPGQKLLGREFAQHLAGPLRTAHVPGHQAGIGLADLGHGLSGGEVDHLLDFQALVGLSPAQDRKVNHAILHFIPGPPCSFSEGPAGASLNKPPPWWRWRSGCRAAARSPRPSSRTRRAAPVLPRPVPETGEGRTPW